MKNIPDEHLGYVRRGNEREKWDDRRTAVAPANTRLAICTCLAISVGRVKGGLGSEPGGCDILERARVAGNPARRRR